MRDALATLPWVETDSIKPDRAKRQVRFTVADPKQFDMAAASEAIAKAGYADAAKLVGPTEK